MAEVNEAAVERLAKDLCEQDDLEWDLEWKMPLPEGAKRRHKRILDEEGRQQYLARARKQLLEGYGQNA